MFCLLSLQRPGVLQLQQLLEAQIAETNRLNDILATERALYGNLAQVVQDAQHAGEARCDHMISYETSFDWLKSIFCNAVKKKRPGAFRDEVWHVFVYQHLVRKSGVKKGAVHISLFLVLFDN